MPEAVDVAIVGGGIIGICTAYALAQAGMRVCVLEKGVLAGEQSSRNWGWVRTLDRDPAEVPLALRANQLWGEIQARADVGFRRTGILYLQEDRHDAQRHQRWLELARACETGATLLDRAAALRLLPESPRPWSGALYSPTDGVAEPGLATQAIAGLARGHGAMVLERCAARGLDLQAGRIAGVVTEHGLVKAQAVLLAGGAWSRLFCGNSGIEFPQLKVRGSVLRTEPFDAPLSATVNGKTFTCRKRADGGYTVSQFGASMADVVPDSFRLMSKFLRAWLANNAFVKVRFGKRFFEELAIPRRFALDDVSPFERCRVLDPAPSARAIAMAWRRLTAAFPVFNAARIAHAWGGYIDVTPDALPVMSQVDGIPGFYLASGFSGHGFGIGPAAGELMADLILGRAPRVDIHPFRLARFAG
ncbi:NAD(P)/FAD-dependent oxidoreductase [Bordetella petrii]|uniref:NAD(P)/FAD-dependent oxidoreductase n=1 Tax=Bordetella petrii TaxID=94624 RepID=UPI00373107BD